MNVRKAMKRVVVTAAAFVAVASFAAPKAGAGTWDEMVDLYEEACASSGDYDCDGTNDMCTAMGGSDLNCTTMPPPERDFCSPEQAWRCPGGPAELCDKYNICLWKVLQ